MGKKLAEMPASESCGPSPRRAAAKFHPWFVKSMCTHSVWQSLLSFFFFVFFSTVHKSSTKVQILSQNQTRTSLIFQEAKPGRAGPGAWTGLSVDSDKCSAPFGWWTLPQALFVPMVETVRTVNTQPTQVVKIIRGEQRKAYGVKKNFDKCWSYCFFFLIQKF